MNARELTLELMEAGLSCGEATRIVVAAERTRARTETLAVAVDRQLRQRAAAHADYLRELTADAGLIDNLSNTWSAAA